MFANQCQQFCNCIQLYIDRTENSIQKQTTLFLGNYFQMKSFKVSSFQIVFRFHSPVGSRNVVSRLNFKVC